MKLKIAFAGLRHGHITALYKSAEKNNGCEITAVSEEDAAARKNAAEVWKINTTHDSFAKMLAEVSCDAVAIGDYYGIRGSRAIAALKAGKHIISDKPLCTSMKELKEIKKLAQKNNLKVGCMLDLRESPNVAAVKKMIDEGRLGSIHAMYFGGQHPLLYGTRPGWYFEKGKHGGTINDIAVHLVDLAQWFTGKSITELSAARTWNASAAECPYFNDSAQLMFNVGGKCGVIADVSYLMPDSIGYTSPLYWKITVWGSKGMVDFAYSDKGVRAVCSNEKEMHMEPQAEPGIDYLNSFLSDISGKPLSLCTESVLDVAEKTLLLQEMADKAAR